MTLESFNPATGELLGSVEAADEAAVAAAIEEAERVQPLWAELALADRARYMRRAADVLLSELDEVARLLSAEQGKPIIEAYSMEVVPTIDALHWIADNGPEILADERIPMGRGLFVGKRSHFTYEPLGVVAVIAPWNYPWSIPFGEVAMALMAGNAVVLKPAELTPLLGDRIAAIFDRAGFPEGLVRVVHGAGETGATLVRSAVRKVFFTGSVETGRKVGEACVSQLKGSVLELGGKDPAIVCADADLDHAVRGIAWGGFANAGQTCSGIERVYVVDELAAPLLAGLVAHAERLRVGDPSCWETEIGPMVSETQYGIVNELVDDAIAAGAERLCGGPRELEGSPGRYIAPTVLAGVEPEMRIMNEEIFGPVLPVVSVGSEEEAIERANDSRFGLGASVWTADRRKGERIAARLESGMAWINDHSYSHAAMGTPWGGVKDSGLGRAHSKLGFLECVEPRLISWEPARSGNLWWHPYDATLGAAIRSAAGLLYGREGERLRALREGGGSLLRAGARTLRR
jgi:acyl-CoA reductase-like NAD-dependent aldehyde dehydrogenase